MRRTGVIAGNGTVKRYLKIAIQCGDTRCYAKPGKPCPHVRVTHMGTRWVCDVFGDRLIEDKPCGWLLRCKRCLDAEDKC